MRLQISYSLNKQQANNMKIKELIEILKTQDENSLVVVEDRDGLGYVEANTTWAKVILGNKVVFLISQD